MKPGTTFAEIIDFVRGLGAKRGLKTEFVMHGRRWGDDGRLITPRANQDRISDVRIEKGNARVWKPNAQTLDGEAHFGWGGMRRSDGRRRRAPLPACSRPGVHHVMWLGAGRAMGAGGFLSGWPCAS